MNDNTCDMNVFEKGIPSVFVVSTPFQVLCALSAIRQLEINEYLFIVHFTKGSIRNIQMKCFLRDYGIQYISYMPNYISLLYYKFRAGRSNKSGYKRFFLGNHFDYSGFYRGISCVSDNASIVYLDDGALSLNLFLGDLVDRRTEKENDELKRIAVHRDVTPFKYYLSIYDGITNPNFIIEKLYLDQLLSSNPESCKECGVILIGTVFEDICRIYEKNTDEMIELFNKLLNVICLENPDESIIFYAHGRDSHPKITEEIIRSNNAKYVNSDVMIEMSILKNGIIPKAIYGFTSTALYTLKMMFPSSRVVNVLFEPNNKNNLYDEICGISKYYLEKEIELFKLKK